MRFLLGVSVGLAALIGLHFAATRWWIGAIASGLVGVLGFLLTFFVWTADRPDEGYEQVLFDGKNSAISVALAVLLVIGGFGLSFVGPHESAVDPSTAKLDGLHDKLTRIYNDISASKLDPAGVRKARADITSAQAALADIPPSTPRSLLVKAAAAELAGLDAYEKCGQQLCQAATLVLLDAKDPLNKYAA